MIFKSVLSDLNNLGYYTFSDLSSYGMFIYILKTILCIPLLILDILFLPLEVLSYIIFKIIERTSENE